MCNVVYSERIVAFIDILGFKTHINKSKNDNVYASNLLSVMNKIGTVKADNEEGSLSQQNLGKEVSVFSDCLVISYPSTFEGGLFYILLDLIHIQLDLIFGNIIFRGGISIGKVYHSGNIVFGPALVRAYELENKIAIYPRIILRKEDFENGIQLSKKHSTDEEKKYVKKLLIPDSNFSKNELYFVDFLSQYDELNNQALYQQLLNQLRNIIVNELASNSDPKIIMKYLWLKTYFNTNADKFNLTSFIIP